MFRIVQSHSWNPVNKYEAKSHNLLLEGGNSYVYHFGRSTLMSFKNLVLNKQNKKCFYGEVFGIDLFNDILRTCKYMSLGKIYIYSTRSILYFMRNI